MLDFSFVTCITRRCLFNLHWWGSAMSSLLLRCHYQWVTMLGGWHHLISSLLVDCWKKITGEEESPAEESCKDENLGNGPHRDLVDEHRRKLLMTGERWCSPLFAAVSLIPITAIKRFMYLTMQAISAGSSSVWRQQWNVFQVKLYQIRRLSQVTSAFQAWEKGQVKFEGNWESWFGTDFNRVIICNMDPTSHIVLEKNWWRRPTSRMIY